MSCHVAPDSISELRHVETLLRRPAEGLCGLAEFGLFSTCLAFRRMSNFPVLCRPHHTKHCQWGRGWFSAAGAGRCTMLIYVVASVWRGFQDVPSVNAGWCLWGSSFERSRAAQTVLISAIERVTTPLLCFLLSQILLFACICLYFPTLKAFKIYFHIFPHLSTAFVRVLY